MYPRVKTGAVLILLSFFYFIVTPSYSQLSGQNIAEFQYGKIPTDDSWFFSIYDRTLLDYDLKSFKMGLTLEQYWSPFSERNYIRPNQLRLQYKTDKWDIKLGNFYETLGRGTLMRTYQIPGAILETRSYRSRNYFHRDVMGAFGKYQAKKWSFKFLAGQPLNNVFPPGQDITDRRPDRVIALGADYQIKSHKLEYNSMYLKNANVEKWYSMVNASGTIIDGVNYYTEITIDNQDGVLGSNDSYAAYLNLNFTFDNLNITTELKDYNNILVGEAVNEPPALVKQHTYRVLNRSTHVPIPLNESGWQVEATYLFKDESSLTFNHARALNDLNLEFVFSEFFLEYQRIINESWDLTLFTDYANDDFKGESNRFSAGFDIDKLLKKRKSVNVEYEFQTFERLDEMSTNMVLSLTYRSGSKFSSSLVTEYSTDPTIIDAGEDYKIWLGGNIKYNPNFRNTFLLFAGTRRGGPACTSGVCYEVLDFEGMEVRYTRRF